MITLIFAPISGCHLLDRYENADEIVYLIEHGDRYHDAECPYVDESATEVLLSAAVSRHFTPDPVCSPPRLEERVSNRTLSILLFGIGGVGTAFIILGIPSLLQRRNTKIKASDIARTRAGESWNTMSPEERRQLVNETISRLNEPSTHKNSDENPHYLD